MAILLKKKNSLWPDLEHFALDEKAIVKELAAKYPGQLATSCKIDSVKPNGNGDRIILYRIKLEHEEKLFYALISKNGSAEASFKLIPFPEDIALPWLKKAADVDFMKLKLKSYFPSIEKVSIIPLAYTPTMRATMQYEISTKSKTTFLVGKTNAHKSPKSTYANYFALNLKAKNAINMPKPKFLLMETKTTFIEKIDGVCLGAFLKSKKLPNILKMLAKQIAHFHKLQIPLSTIRKKEKDLKTLQKAAGQIVESFPEIKPRLDELFEKIYKEIDSRHQIEAPIHADFHYSNIFVGKDDVSMLDFDEMALGDPAVDIGRFLASMRGPWLKNHPSLKTFYPLRDLFLENYLKQSKKSIYDIYLFEAANLFTSMASFIRFRHPDLKYECKIFLKEAENLFEKASPGKHTIKENSIFTLTPPWSKKEITMNLKFVKRLKWAQNQKYMQALLAPYLYEKTDIELTTFKILSHVALDRCVKISAKISGYIQNVKVERDLIVFVFENKINKYLFNKYLFNKFIPKKDRTNAIYLPEILAVAKII